MDSQFQCSSCDRFTTFLYPHFHHFLWKPTISRSVHLKMGHSFVGRDILCPILPYHTISSSFSSSFFGDVPCANIKGTLHYSSDSITHNPVILPALPCPVILYTMAIYYTNLSCKFNSFYR